MNDRIVFWSGGYDSTLLLYNEAERIKKEHEYKVIEAWSLKWSHLGEYKVKSEEMCRKNFIAFIKESFNVTIDNKTIKLNHDMQPYIATLPQASLFIPLCVYLAKEHDTILFGFHRGDDYWHYSSKFDKIRRDMNDAMNKEVKFEFPLEWIPKSDILNAIRNTGIERYCWTCEGVTEFMKPCGNCLPRRNLKIAEIELDIKLKNREPGFNKTTSILWSEKKEEPEIKEKVTDKDIKKAINTLLDVIRKDTKNEDLQELPAESSDEEKKSEHQENSERGDQIVLENRKSES